MTCKCTDVLDASYSYDASTIVDKLTTLTKPVSDAGDDEERETALFVLMAAFDELVKPVVEDGRQPCNCPRCDHKCHLPEDLSDDQVLCGILLAYTHGKGLCAEEGFVEKCFNLADSEVTPQDEFQQAMAEMEDKVLVTIIRSSRSGAYADIRRKKSQYSKLQAFTESPHAKRLLSTVEKIAGPDFAALSNAKSITEPAFVKGLMSLSSELQSKFTGTDEVSQAHQAEMMDSMKHLLAGSGGIGTDDLMSTLFSMGAPPK